MGLILDECQQSYERLIEEYGVYSYEALGYFDIHVAKRRYYLVCDRIRRHIEDSYPRGSSIDILDMGCGNGRFFEYMSGFLASYLVDAELSYHYYGFDRNERFLQEFSDSLKVKDYTYVSLSSSDSIPADWPEKFKVVIGLGVVQECCDHVLARDLIHYLFTRSDGLTILSTITSQGWHTNRSEQPNGLGRRLCMSKYDLLSIASDLKDDQYKWELTGGHVPDEVVLSLVRARKYRLP